MRSVLGRAVGLGVACALAACLGVAPRFPTDVQAALASGELRRLETERFIIYYPAHRRAELDRFVARATGCDRALRAAAKIHNAAADAKPVIAMPEVAFNNAFVLAGAGGYDAVSVIPTLATADYTTDLGLVPDPGVIACHELVHYVHLQQLRGLWRVLGAVLGPVYTPQLGYDPWFLEGLATHYEAQLVPGLGRPAWPVFTGMFAAAYAGRELTGGELSEHGRRASVGHHYLVGAMFARFLAERSGEAALWAAIADQAGSWTGALPAGTFERAFGASLGELVREFSAWSARTFPARRPPPGQRALAVLGTDARYARGRDGTEAWVAEDLDAPPRLIVRAADGAVLAELALVDVAPPRTLAQASPSLVSGLSITADGQEVWLTMIDAGATEQVPRLLRWRRGETGLTERARALGPGATIDPTGATYYYCAVDGDRWSLAAWDVARGARRTVLEAPPGTYVLAAQVSADGRRLAASVWDGRAFVAWVIDAATGQRIAALGGEGTPVWDASFTDDGRPVYLGVVEGRFQAIVDGAPATDAPYAVLAARSVGGTLRFLSRDGWRWTLAEAASPPSPPSPPPPPTTPLPPAGEPSGNAAPVASEAVDAAPAAPGAGTPAAPLPTSAAALPPEVAPAAPARGERSTYQVVSDGPYSRWEQFFRPQLRAPIVLLVSSGLPHLGAVIGGGDPLGLHRWSVAGYVQPRGSITDHLHGGGDVAYLNTMLAPWQLAATAGFIDWVDPVATDDPEVTRAEERRTRDAELAIARVWREALALRIGARWSDDRVAPPDGPALHRRLGGPEVAVAWSAAEATSYAGPRRALAVDAAAGYYPGAWSTLGGDVLDLAAGLTVVAPLPIGRRHTLLASVRGRALVARDDTGLLQLGGEAGVVTLWDRRSTAAAPPGFDGRRLPPNLRFIEAVRGYEDYAIATDRAAVGELAWRYPLIVDRGVAATFGVLPSTFLRELALELFAAGARDRAGHLHAAVGASAALRLSLLRAPLRLVYQLARRVRDDHALTQLAGFALDL